MRSLVVIVFCLAMPGVAGCGGGGQFGYAREYTPLSAEEAHIEGETFVTYEDLRRDPADYAAVTVGWFGIVTAMEGNTVTMDFRTLQPRNLCSDSTESSCRVTVSHRPGGSFTTTLDLSGEHASGENRVWTRSLIKVYGTPTGEFNEDGGPVLRTLYFRHWPRAAYVTTADAAIMRR